MKSMLTLTLFSLGLNTVGNVWANVSTTKQNIEQQCYPFWTF